MTPLRRSHLGLLEVVRERGALLSHLRLRTELEQASATTASDAAVLDQLQRIRHPGTMRPLDTHRVRDAGDRDAGLALSSEEHTPNRAARHYTSSALEKVSVAVGSCS